jgi:uncharacterized membrane protein YfcA
MDHVFLLPSFLGLLIGLLLALTGAGGGILSVPLLVFFLHLPIVQAAPIGLVAITLSAAMGAAIGLYQKQLRYKTAAWMALFGLCFSPIGFWVSLHTPNIPLMWLFAMVLMWVGIQTWKKATQDQQGIQDPIRPPPPCMLDTRKGKLIWTSTCAKILAASGAVAGFLSGLLGVGGGFVIVPLLKRYSNFSQNSIITTSLGILTLVSLGGVVNASLHGAVNWHIAVPFALGSLLGMLSGRKIANKIPTSYLHKGFALLTGITACILIFKTL